MKNLEKKKKKNKKTLSKLEKEEARKKKYPFLYKEISFVNENGETKTITKKRSLKLVYGCIILAIFLLCFIFISFPRSVKIDQVFVIFGKMFSDSPNLVAFGGYWGYLTGVAIPKIWETVEMCVIATTIGSLISIPIFLLCARNVVRHAYIYQPVRTIFNIIRTIPTFVLAVICVALFGIGSFAGVIAMTIFTIGIVFKLMYEYTETCDMNPFEAMTSTGASRGQAFMVGVWPQVTPAYISNVIYTFEINIRASVVLGFVGAGGIRQIMNDAIADRAYEKVGAMLIPLFILVLFLQLLSSYLRRKLQ